jgi:hypothetical protein
MSQPFHLELSGQEKRYLKDLVRLSILKHLQQKDDGPPEPPTEQLKEPLGAFVTLKKQEELRGCIGYLVGSKPLFETVWDMARAAAFRDPRFSPLEAYEMDDLSVEISILSPIEPCPDVEKIEIGRHGLIMRRGMQQGLLLPQVAVEWGWDAKKFLEQTCLKAGLPSSAWREKDTEILWFEAEVF